MANFSLTWLAQVLLDAGLKVSETNGWKSRGRGEMGTVKGVMCHHTATKKSAPGNMPTLQMIIDGRSDLPGPLAQLGLGRDGTFFIIAAGRCNHAGGGDWQGIKTGNTSFIGIEAENSGLPDNPWPDVQIDAYERGVAAILKKIKADAIMCCGHKEYALPHGRKSDPSFEMKPFRMNVAAIMAGAAPAASVIPADDGAGRKTLRRGDTGAAVKALQTKLGINNPGGTFDGPTEAAVRQFQRDNGLVPDGIAGPRTLSTLNP
jgi:hypothetical protein